MTTTKAAHRQFHRIDGARNELVCDFSVGTATPSSTRAFQHLGCDLTRGPWMQHDPLGYVEGANLYQFVSSDAVALSDPAGLQSGPTTRPGSVACISVVLKFVPDPPRWTKYADGDNQERIGFHINTTFKVKGDYRQGVYGQDEDGAIITSEGEGVYANINGQTTGQANNIMDKEKMRWTRQGDYYVMTWSDPVGQSYNPHPPPGSGSFKVELKDFTVFAWAIDSTGAEYRSKKYKLNGAVRVKIGAGDPAQHTVSFEVLQQITLEEMQ